MRYLVLIHLNESQLDAMPEAEMSDLNARHVALNRELRESGHWVEADALAPVAATRQVRVRGGRTTVLDGPYAEAKEHIAGFYLIEAADMAAAIGIAERIPSAPLGTIEVREVRRLIVDGQPVEA